jgi:hypothetical protein
MRRAGHCDALLLSGADLFRNLSSRQGLGDAVFGSLASPMQHSTAVLERPVLNGWDLISLLRRRDAAFIDFSLLQPLPLARQMLLGRGPLSGWEDFRSVIETGPFPRAVQETVISKALHVVNSIAGKAILEVAAAGRVLDLCRPRVVVLTTSYDGFPRAFVYAAHARGIPVIELQHGIIHPLHRGYLYFFPKKPLPNYVLPDRLLVYGERFRDLLVGLGSGSPARALRVVGNIRLAEYIAQLSDRAAVTAWVHRQLHVPEGYSLLTVSCQPESRDFLISCLHPALADLAKHRVVLCLKPHPSEVSTAKAAYRPLLRCPNVRLVTDGDVGLYDLLIASCLHATVSSTVLLECLSLGIPNVLIQGPFHEGLLRLLGQDSGSVPLVGSAEDLLAAVRAVTADTVERDAAIRRGLALGASFFISDDKVIDRIQKEIEECAALDLQHH